MNVSLIIPTWNGGKWVDALLTMLAQQTLLPAEILLVDSGSTDESVAIIQQHQRILPNLRLAEIAQQDFDHGGTRTWAARQTQGEILIYMTQDAIPATKNSLELLVQPLLDNKKIVASYGRQLPASDASFFSAHLRQFNYPAQSQLRSREDAPRFGFKTIFISNSFAAWRREPLAEQGFFPEQLLFGEDTLALAKLLTKGYYVQYSSEATVFHSHNYSLWQDVKRYFDIGVFHAEHQEWLMQFGGPGGTGRNYVRSELRLLLEQRRYKLLPEWFCRNLGKFVAYHLGKRQHLFPKSLAKKLSMNPAWQGWNA